MPMLAARVGIVSGEAKRGATVNVAKEAQRAVTELRKLNEKDTELRILSHSRVKHWQDFAVVSFGGAGFGNRAKG